MSLYSLLQSTPIGKLSIQLGPEDSEQIHPSICWKGLVPSFFVHLSLFISLPHSPALMNHLPCPDKSVLDFSAIFLLPSTYCHYLLHFDSHHLLPRCKWFSWDFFVGSSHTLPVPFPIGLLIVCLLIISPSFCFV
jgi:hypothetical protein